MELINIKPQKFRNVGNSRPYKKIVFRNYELLSN